MESNCSEIPDGWISPLNNFFRSFAYTQVIKLTYMEEKITFRPIDNEVTLEVRLEDDTVWLTQEQMAQLFDKERSVVAKHINNIFSEEELSRESNVQILHITGIPKPVGYYSLDVIISVGYRVKSLRGTQFRIWATKLLKDHLVKGYTLNQQRLLSETQKYADLQLQLANLKRVLENESMEIGDAKGLLKVITDYADSLKLLEEYDKGKLVIDSPKREAERLDAEVLKSEIDRLRLALDTSNLFGVEREGGYADTLDRVFQAFGGQEVYPSIEEKAANLFYLIIKNHPFVDGNKRIGAYTFLRFLEVNGLLYRDNGSRAIEQNAIVAMALMVAQSPDEDKEQMVRLVVKLVNT